ncbi:MAG: glycosyltransferase [Prevotella sp.]|jgi:hypothetical protein|nr:glycosyltransferase [Prevotella sp.]
MNLYLFPALASSQGGYNLGVLFAYNKLQVKQDDVVVWCLDKTDLVDNAQCIRKTDIFLKYPPLYSLRSLHKVLTDRFHQEIDYKAIAPLVKYDFEHIHCDEVTFYRAIRKLYPDKKIFIRFHNVFSRIKERERVLSVKQDWRFELKMRLFTKLEFEIFKDNNVYKIFISDEDRNYYTSMMGRTIDSEVWYYEPTVNKIEQNKLLPKLVWFGGVEGHKTTSVRWFINDVFPKIKKQIPSAEFHLWGSQTNQFDNPTKNIFAHGKYLHDDLPLKGEALYINPDIIGGGIKIKLLTYFKEGVPFISTPFGFEGYKEALIDNQYCFVIEMDKWAEKIIQILKP